jgi:Ohr subfamily peroxiredoxin
MKTIYTTNVTAKGGREGKVKSNDGNLNLELRAPGIKEDEGKNYTNPEQLFAAGYAACFDSALNYVARLQNVKIESQVTATVNLLQSEKEGFKLSVTIEAAVNGVEKELAYELLKNAHATCPYSKAVNNNVDVDIHLN